MVLLTISCISGLYGKELALYDEQKKIFVVGGSSGIGLEIVKKLQNQQNEVFVGSRTRENLQDRPQVQPVDYLAETVLYENPGYGPVSFDVLYCQIGSGNRHLSLQSQMNYRIAIVRI